MWHFKSKFVLVVGDEGALLLPFGIKSGASLFAATADDDGREKILSALRQHPKAHLTILANGAAQEFRVETLPPLGFLDRNKLMERRLLQAFPHATGLAARSLDSTHALMASLHRDSIMTNWLAATDGRTVTLGLLPVESKNLVMRLMPDADKGWIMLLAAFQTGGLRQIVMQNGRLVFTRQTAALPDNPKQMATALRRLIKDSRDYLARFGLSDSANLRVGLLLEKTPIMALLKNADFRGMALFTPDEAAEKLGVRLDAGGAGIDVLFATWIAEHRNLWLPLDQPALRDKQQGARMQRLGWRAALAVMALGLMVTSFGAVPLLAQLYDNHRLAAAIDAKHQQLVQKQAGQMPVADTARRLRLALERRRIFSEPQPEPWDVLRQLGAELGDEARVGNMDWQDDGTLRIDIRFVNAKKARLGREDIVRNFRKLADHLSSMMPGYSVEVTHYPFPALPDEALTNAAAKDDSGEAAAASFTIRRRP